MLNLDVIPKERIEVLQSMVAAIRSGSEEEFSQSFQTLSEQIEENVKKDFKQFQFQADANVLAQRGVRQLTSEEREYYQHLGEAMGSKSPQQALAGFDKVLPKTVIDSVFDNMRENHPLLEEINFQNTGALVEILLSKTSGVGGWGELCDEIDKELSGEFELIDLTLKKAFAFIPVCSAMLDIGPEWLDRWVRELLSETIATQLEVAIVDGDGKKEPIGTTRKLEGAVDGVYPRKTPIKLSSFDPMELGKILNVLSVGHNNKRRPVKRVLFLVSYSDYYTKVFPATTVRSTTGSFNTDVFPWDIKVIPTVALAANEGVMGLGRQYFFGLGTSKGGKIEYSDHVRFLQHHRVYRVFLYGNGRPTDENAFVLLDISDLKPTVQKVEVISATTTLAAQPMMKSDGISADTTQTPEFKKAVADEVAKQLEKQVSTGILVDAEVDLSSKSKEELRIFAEEHGIEVDGRKSEDEIRQVIQDELS